MRTIPLQIQDLCKQNISGLTLLWIVVLFILCGQFIVITPALAASSLSARYAEADKFGKHEGDVSPLGTPIIYVSSDEEAMMDFSVLEAGGSQTKYYFVEYFDFNSNILASIVLDDPSGSFSIAFEDVMEFSDSLTVDFSMYATRTIMVKYAPTVQGPHSATIKHTGDIDSNTPEPVLLSIQGNTPVGLPIELLSFKGKLDQEAFVLHWATASETNNSHFELEMMEDPEKGFVYVGSVNSKAVNSTSLQHYNFRYTYDGGAAYCYFRLKQVDIDRSFTYSSTIAIQTQGLAQLRLQAAPNPLTPFSQLRITAPVAGLLQIIITDLQGTPVSRQEVAVQRGENKVELLLQPGLPAGIYLLSATTGTGVSHLRLVKN